MSELGRLLAETRTARQLSIADIEEAIRVRQKYIDALERGDYAALPPGAIARGFLRTYARYLGLDPWETMRLYMAESGDPGLIVPGGSLDGTRPPDYRPLEVSLIDEGSYGRRWRWPLAVVVVVALAAVGWWLLNHPGTVVLPQPPALLAALGPQRTATSTATPTTPRPTITPPAAPESMVLLEAQAAPGVTTGEATPPVSPGEPSALTPTPTSDLLTLPIPTAQPTPTNTPTVRPTSIPTTTVGISLTMKATQRAWMKVTADGQVVFQDLLEAGQERGYGADQQLTVLTGNAGGVNLRLNQEDLGTIGEVGQVIERSWTVDGDGRVAEVSAERRTATAAASQASAPVPTP